MASNCRRAWRGVLRRGRVDLRAADVASPDGDEALALQDPERLPERWTRDLELTDELILFREHAPVRQRSRDDPRSADEEGDAWWPHEQACVSEGTCPHSVGSLCRSVLSVNTRQ